MKWGYGLTIFGVLSFITTMTTKETMTLQNFLISLFFFILGIILIFKNKKKDDYKNSNNIIYNIGNKDNDVDVKYINDISSSENIIFPIHIKYRRIEVKDYKDEKLNFYRDMWYNPSIANQNQPTYNCILDNKVVATLSSGQETELDIGIGEHIIFFEPINNLPRNKIKNK